MKGRPANQIKLQVLIFAAEFLSGAGTVIELDTDLSVENILLNALKIF